ncbi:MAG: membrane protein insertion efficiency factor YidD [Gemmataceae bacterium]
MILSWVDRAVGLAVGAVVASYRLIFHPVIPSGLCRYTPTCSQYMLESIHKYGGFRGTWRGVLRVLRCRPGCPGGHDPA